MVDSPAAPWGLALIVLVALSPIAYRLWRRLRWHPRVDELFTAVLHESRLTADSLGLHVSPRRSPEVRSTGLGASGEDQVAS